MGCQVSKQEDLIERDVQFLKGVGPKRAELLAKLGIRTVEDLLLHLPTRYVDRRTLLNISSARPGQEGVFLAKVQATSIRPRGKNRDVVVDVSDDTGFMQLIWRNSPFMTKRFPQGASVLFWGKVYLGRNRIKTVFHPEYEVFSGEVDVERSLVAGRILPVYRLTEGLRAKDIRAAIHNAMQLGQPFEDVVPEDLRKKRKLYPRHEAFKQVHFPEDLQKAKAARDCLAYEELLLFFLRFFSQSSFDDKKGLVIPEPGPLVHEFISNLGFQLTDSQREAMSHIDADMASGNPMHRLLQGDVGSGKTVVAAYAALRVVEHGMQAAIMSPTEILAEQTYSVFARYLEPLGVKVVLLESSLTKKARAKALRAISTGAASVAVGTHALITEDVNFRNLALAVVDEQHRFGVAQRALLVQKGVSSEVLPHFLVMTATPIPRTLALAFYGNLDVSVMKEKPANRGPVETKWVRTSQRNSVYKWIFQEALEGRQAYVVAPLVQKSEKLDIAAAEQLFEELRAKAPKALKMGLVHGRIPTNQRRQIMEDFRAGRIKLLVSTTVIEVGVDVPQATRMVIEHAERFGLSQLHQLRGRINRSPEKAFCILITPSNISQEARARMEIMTASSDGFEIAEHDLKLRGPGQLMGTKQHGVPEFKIANLVEDYKVIAAAKADADALVSRRPELLEDSQLSKALARRLRSWAWDMSEAPGLGA